MKLFRNKKVIAAVLTLLAVVGAAALAYKPLMKIYRKVAKLPDENGMYQIGEHWFQELETLKPQAAENFATKLKTLQEKYLTEENRVFWAIVPDKSWYAREEGYPTFDHGTFQKQLETLLPEFTGIDLTNILELDNYYKSDRHWKQETLQPVLYQLGQAMGFDVQVEDFEPNIFSPFYGDFSKYISGKKPEDTLIYLTNSDTEAAFVENYQAKDVHTVYDIPRLESKLPYDVFLSGVTPVVTISNPNASSEKDLVIFRDSFGSSLAPLLCGEYRTITLIDLRFMLSSLIPDHVTFTNQDVLFLYSDWIASNSSLLK